MKAITIARLGFILLSASLASADQFGNFYYTSDGSIITITGYSDPGGPLIIPSAINGLPVVVIGNYAFQNKVNMTSVTIPTSVTTIGSQAFANCYGLTNAAIPGSVTNIGDHAFSYSGLIGVTIPGSVISIGDNAFYDTGLIAITVDPANLSYTSVDGVLFNKSQSTLLQYPSQKAGTYAIPISVGSIRNYGFASCRRLTGVTMRYFLVAQA